MEIGEPQYLSEAETLYVTPSTEFTITSSDLLSGVASVQYRLDAGEWVAYAGPFTVSGDGAHTIGYRAIDNVGNVEAGETVSVVVDGTAPKTELTVGEPRYEGGDVLYVTGATVFTLSATDGASGVASTVSLGV